jgi:hypothetical protein
MSARRPAWPLAKLWLVKRGAQQWQMTGLEMLQDWARIGNIRRDDEIWNPAAEAWLRASDVPELAIDLSPSAASHVCRVCGHAGSPIVRSKANGCVAVTLLLLLLVPGIIYLVWAASTPGDNVCPKCGGVNTMIPNTSPLATQLLDGSAQAAPSLPVPELCSACGKYYPGKVAFCPHCGRAQPA